MADNWDVFIGLVTRLKDRLKNLKASQVKAGNFAEGKRTVQAYFRKIRPELIALGFEEIQLKALDDGMQDLLAVSNDGRHGDELLAFFDKTWKELGKVELVRERKLGERYAERKRELVVWSPLETQIHQTLEKLVPTAAASYRQVTLDLADKSRVSFRGTANELREVIREVLDTLAPDNDVRAATGFQLEAGREKPTQRQKVRFILNKRGLGETARAAPESSVQIVDESIAKFTRTLYDRGSLATHTARAVAELVQLKRYSDAVLAELLLVS